MLIETQNLNAGYGAKTVLHDVSLTFDGGAVGLLGPNGAGKSTLLKTLLGFLPPISGSAQVFGLPLPQSARLVRGRVGYMPEVEALIQGINAVNFVAYMGELSGLPRSASIERAHEVLQYVGLGESRYRNLETYSTGMKQRAKLAQAIVHDPALVLLDEPTNGMDPQGREEMLELVDDLSRNKGISVILCSHLLKDVETVAREIIVLGNGRVVAKRMTDQQKAKGPMLFSVRIRGPVPAFRKAAQQAGLEVHDTEESSKELLVKIPDGNSAADIFQAAARSGCVVQRLERRTEKLEDLFIEAVGELGNAHL
ncbi:MAG: ABC transporter ATP-binding protein [Candidatus Sumerlaeaceae bacterium]|nr:ABC transporter ATP-binding protein [Candidatus Sumerlaeaceae bacterium]